MMLEELQRRHYSELTALRRRAGGLFIIQAANSLRLKDVNGLPPNPDPIPH
jgi:hypothetical protein